MDQEVKKAPKKGNGNKNTEIVIGSAAAKLGVAAAAILAASTKVGELSEIANESTLKVVQLEDKIGSLKQDYDNKVAQNKLEIELAYKADELSYVSQYAAKNHLTIVEDSEFNTLKSDLEKTQREFSTEVAKAVAIATKTATTDADNKIKMAELQAKATEADNKAKIENLLQQNTFLSQQVEMWKDALKAERDAGVERAKASSIHTMNFGQGAK